MMGEDMTWFRQQTVPVKALPVYLLAYLHCVDLHEQLHDHSVMLTHILYDSNLQKKGDVTSGSYITHITIIIIIITLSLHHHYYDHVIHARLIDLEIIIIISYSL